MNIRSLKVWLYQYSIPAGLAAEVEPAQEPGEGGANSSCLIAKWAVLYSRVFLRVLFIRVPYSIGDPKRDLSLENYPHTNTLWLKTVVWCLGFRVWGSGLRFREYTFKQKWRTYVN